MAQKTLWRDRFLWDAYELAKAGVKEHAIAKTLGISWPTLRQWVDRKPLFAKALRRGRKALHKRTKSNATPMEEYVFDRLSPEEQKIWRRIMRASKCKSGKAIIDSITEGYGKPFRQHLFIHALVHNNYSITGSCRMVGISIDTFEHWRTNDPDFQKLFKAVIEAKKDRLEGAFFDLVSEGAEGPITHGLRTLAGDRGYRDQKHVDVNVQGQITQAIIQVDVDRLPVAARLAILEEINRCKQVESTVVTPAVTSAITGAIG